MYTSLSSFKLRDRSIDLSHDRPRGIASYPSSFADYRHRGALEEAARDLSVDVRAGRRIKSRARTERNSERENGVLASPRGCKRFIVAHVGGGVENASSGGGTEVCVHTLNRASP